MEKLTPSLFISPLLFEHTLFPLSPRLSIPSFLSFLKELSLLPLVGGGGGRREEGGGRKEEGGLGRREEGGGGGYLIRFEQFKLRMELSQLPFQPYEAEIFFLLAKLLWEEDPSFLHTFGGGAAAVKKEEGGGGRKGEEGPRRADEAGKRGEEGIGRRDIVCELRVLLIILLIQTFGSHGSRLSMEKKGSWGGGGNSPLNNNPFNEGRGGGGSVFSPLNSPRSKAMRFFNIYSENQNILNFVKINIKTILKLISSENGNEDEIMITNEKVDFLNILLANDGFPSKNNQFSGIIPLNKFLNVKGNLDIVSEWIANNLGCSENSGILLHIKLCGYI